MGRRGHHQQRRILATGLAVVGLVSIASAQVEDGGKTLSLTFGQSLSYSDNIELVSDPQDDTLRYSTRLGLAYRDVTRTQRLEFSTNAFLEVNNPGETEISDPSARLLYAREGANSRFSFSTNYRRSDLDDVTVPLGVLFPELDDVVDNIAVFETGVRTDTAYALEIETGMESLIGFRLNLSANDRRYEELQLFELSDNRLVQGEAELTFRIDPALTARVVLSGSDFQSEDEDATERRQFYWGVGVNYEVSPSTTFDILVARQTVERTDQDGDRETDGLRVSTGLTRALPNGEIAVNFSSQPTLNGRQSTLRVNRDQALARGGQLSYGGGISHNNELGTEPVFNIAYVKPLRRGRFNIAFDQEARSAETTSEQVLQSRLSLGYALALSPTVNFSARAGLNQIDVLATDEYRRSLDLRSDLVGQINDVSSWSVGATVSDTSRLNEGVKTGEQRYGIEMAYRRALTRDWNMVARYQHSAILNDLEADRRSNTISLGIERSFDVRF